MILTKTSVLKLSYYHPFRYIEYFIRRQHLAVSIGFHWWDSLFGDNRELYLDLKLRAAVIRDWQSNDRHKSSSTTTQTAEQSIACTYVETWNNWLSVSGTKRHSSQTRKGTALCTESVELCCTGFIRISKGNADIWINLSLTWDRYFLW